ncbi:MAG: hypothetical protein DWP97_12880 [Calditrichaeota bacterium]|nr:MAG: hypothetical protein DWP97_12880 [Calditrichota bacterium]
MKVGELERFGIPVQITERWKKRQGESLLPIQQKAIRKKLLGQPGGERKQKEQNMIISAPTSSGKSFCAEIAALHALTARRKVVMLFPLKSLAEQTYQLLRETYDSLGIKIIIVTSDHPENDHAFASSDFQIAVCIYEKFDLFLTNSLDRLKTIGLIVVDEIQTIAEPGRGATLERLLTKIKSSVYTPKIVGLSAVIGDDSSSAGKLAEWLNASLVEEQSRPVDLIRGVAAGGLYKFRSFNNGDDGEEPFAVVEAGDDPFNVFAEQLKASDSSTLIFLKSRMETVDAAFRLAASVSWPEAKDALSQLADEEPSFLIRSLRQALGRGVAFHNSDLTPQQRKIIENAFIGKEVKALFSTTTLAMGVNLSADNVYLETVKYSSGRYQSRPSLVPVSRAEFDNMTGRAGRYQTTQKEQIGKAVILAESEFDRDILWQNYIDSYDADRITSVFDSQPFADWLLDMIACGLLKSRDKDAVLKLYGKTLASLTANLSVKEQIEPAFELLESLGFIQTSPEFALTELGRAVSGCGLAVAESAYYTRNLLENFPHSEIGWLTFVLSATGWNLPPSILSRYEQSNNLPLKMFFSQYEYSADELRLLLGEKLSSKPLSYRQSASLKALLLLEAWRSLVPLERLEEQFQMHLGQIRYLGETVAHLLSAVAELAASLDRDTEVKQQLAQIAFSVRFGLPYEFKSIHRYFGAFLNRKDYAALQNAGVFTIEEFCRLDQTELNLFFAGKDKVMNINEKIKQIKEEVHVDPRTNNALMNESGLASMLFAEPEMIEIDGSYDRERYLVKINGFPVRLTGKSFKYFVKLAWSRLNGESGWIYKEEIEHGFNQARYLYRMKGEIGSGLNSNWSIFENNRLGYYRLNAEPSKIKINIENLRNHPDFEIREMVEQKMSEKRVN